VCSHEPSLIFKILPEVPKSSLPPTCSTAHELVLGRLSRCLPVIIRMLKNHANTSLQKLTETGSKKLFILLCFFFLKSSIYYYTSAKINNLFIYSLSYLSYKRYNSCNGVCICNNMIMDICIFMRRPIAKSIVDYCNEVISRFESFLLNDNVY